MEDLTGCRERTIHKRRRNERREHSSWSYYQLESFIRYKAEAKGIAVVLVSPRNTSKMCSECKKVGDNNRPAQSLFICKHCGFSLNADLNAARNIRNRHLDAIHRSNEMGKCYLSGATSTSLMLADCGANHSSA